MTRQSKHLPSFMADGWSYESAKLPYSPNYLKVEDIEAAVEKLVKELDAKKIQDESQSEL